MQVDKLIRKEIGRLEDEIYRRKASGMYLDELPRLAEELSEAKTALKVISKVGEPNETT